MCSIYPLFSNLTILTFSKVLGWHLRNEMSYSEDGGGRGRGMFVWRGVAQR